MNKEFATDCGGINPISGATELVFILDKSGSMAGMEQDTVGGFNAMLDRQRKLGGKVYVSTLFFSNDTQVVHDRISLDRVLPLSQKDYQVGGCTALFDAIGGAIMHIRNIHKYARYEDVPERTVFVITTDGLENASTAYSGREIKELISKMQEEFKWEFLFLAANIDAVEAAEHIGIKKERAANYRVQQSKAMFNEMSETICTYRSTGAIPKDWAKNIDSGSDT